MSDDFKHDIDDPLLNEEAGHGSGHADSAVRPFICASVAAIGAMMFGYTLGFSSPALPAMIHEGGPFSFECDTAKTPNTFKSSQGDLFSSLVNIGCMVGALLGGQLCDKIGRKGSILAACIPFAGGWVWIALASTFVPIIFARLFTGIAVGIVSVSVPVYIAEIAPARLRGALGTVNQLGVVFGIVFVYSVGYALPHHDVTNLIDGKACGKSAHILTVRGYKELCWIGVIMTGLLFALMSLMPETPNWLCKQGREEEAEAVLIKLRGASSPDDVSNELLSYCNIDDDQANGEEKDSSVAALWEPGTRMPTIIGCGLMVFQQFSGINAVIFFSGQILADAGMSDQDLGAMLLMIVQLAVTVVACFLIDKAGRTLLMKLACSGMTVCAFTMGLIFYLKHHSSDNTGPAWLSLASLFGYIVFFSLGLGAVPWVMIGEVFPEHIRSTAASVATCINWTCSFILTESFTSMTDGLTPYGTFWFFAIVTTCCAVFVYTLVPETKGKTLQEIEDYFRKTQ